MSVPAPVLDAERIRRARRIRVFRRALGVAELFATLAAMALLYAWGAAAAVRDALAGTVEVARTVTVALGVLAVNWLVGVPFALVAHGRERAEGLSVQSWRGLAVDLLKSAALTLVIGGACAAAWYRIAPLPLWWAIAVGGSFALSALGVLLAPLVLRLFFRLEPLHDPALEERIFALGARAGVGIAGVFRWALSEKSTTANAAVVGLGPTKRIIIADTLLSAFAADETEAVVAHEIGHVVHRDPARFFLLFGVVLAVALLVVRVALDALAGGGAADVATFPLLVLGVGVVSFLLSPLALAYSRRRESAADAFAARITAPRPLARALVRLTAQNLADPDPPRWEERLFMSHPSLRTRLADLGAPAVGPDGAWDGG